MKKQVFLSSAILLLSCSSVWAQSKIKDGTVTGSSSLPNVNAVLELESTKRGLLMPRVALQSTTFPAPLSAFVAGMVVYNTATASDVTPGYYYCDGTAWRKMAYLTPSLGGAGNDLSNDNGIIVTGGTGTSLKATSLRLDSNAVARFINQSPVKDSVAVVMTKSPVRDSIINVVTKTITTGGVNGNNLTNDNGIIVTGGAGTSLKATSLRLDSNAVARFINQSPVKDSIAVVMTKSPVKDSIINVVTKTITTGGVNGNNLTNDNGIIVTGGNGTSLKATSLRLDSNAVARFINQSPVKDSIAVVLTKSPVKDTLAVMVTKSPVKDSIVSVVNININSGGVNGKNLTNDNGIIVTGGAGTSLKATSLRLDSNAVARFINQSPVKDSIAVVVTKSPVRDSIINVVTKTITTGGVNGNNLTNDNGIIVTGGTGTSLKATSLRLDSNAVARFINQSPVKDSVVKVVNNTINTGGVNGKDLTNDNGIIVTGGAGTSLKATSLRLDSNAVARFINQSPVKDSIAVVMTKSPVKDSIVNVVNNRITATQPWYKKGTSSGATLVTDTLTHNAPIQIVDGSQGAFKVLTSDANGLATWSYKSVSTVRVMATNPKGPSGTYALTSFQPIKYTTEILDIDNAYDTSTGVFTAPRDGFYTFEVATYITSSNTAPAHALLDLLWSGSPTTYELARVWEADCDATGNFYLHQGVNTVRLFAGQTITPTFYDGGTNPRINNSTPSWPSTYGLNRIVISY